jgi:hypothetical protein
MKKIFLFTCILLSAIAGFSQVHYGIKGGLNIANEVLSVEDNGVKISESGSTIASFHIGFFADIPVSKNVHFAPELLFSGKGSNFNSTNNNGDPDKVKLRPYYLDIPLNILYTHNLSKGASLFLGAGPQFGYGLFGKATTSDSTQDVFETGGFKKFDFGINFIGGVELMSGLRVSVNYTIGLVSIADDSEVQSGENVKFKNHVFGISLGYILSKKK